MCRLITESTFTLPGWGCCQCHTYNGAQRHGCRGCVHRYCGPPFVVTEEMDAKTLLGVPVRVITKIEKLS